MFNGTVLCVPRSDAARRAGDYLSELGLHVTRTAAPDVTHVLLPVPSFPAGDEYLAHILADLPENIIISGGNLSSLLLKDYTTVDFLQDPYYLAENAAITASCALKIAENETKKALNKCSILIVGWGRIGKCLCRQLDQKGASVSVAVRKNTDRAMICALGYRGISISEAERDLKGYDVILNTVPAMVLPDMDAKEGAVILELASKPGMSGANIIDCRGLPNKMAPDLSGKLIAKTFMRLLFRKEVDL